MMEEQLSSPTGRGVIVLGVDSQIGLAVVRDLGRAGVPVVGVARTKQAVGLYSRYLLKGRVYRGRDEGLLDLLNQMARDHDAPYIMTVSEGDIVFLNEHRARLQGLTPLIPGMEAIRMVTDKARIYEMARQLDIAVPTTAPVDDEGQVLVSDEQIDFPVVLKWSEPGTVQPALRQHGLPFHKAEYCHTARELDEALRRYRPLGLFPLVQNYCPGQGLGHMIHMHDGRPLLRFVHRRLHEWPPEGGYSTLCESQPVDLHPQLMEKSVALLKAIQWQGPAMVEYRYDPQTERAVLMEINGRFWGSLPLAVHAGARFPVLLYHAMGLGRVGAHADTYRPGVRCKFLLPDLKRLWRILREPERIQDKTLRFNRAAELTQFILFFFDPRSRYYVMSMDDLRPLLYDLWFSFSKRTSLKNGRSDTRTA